MVIFSKEGRMVKGRMVKGKRKHSPLPWYVGKCNTKNCWCRTIMTKKGSDKLEDCVVPSGAISKEDAEFIVKIMNKYGVKNEQG